MRIGVPREVTPQETRVALVPDAVARLKKLGAEVAVESGAGAAATFADAAYEAAGAALVTGARALYAQSDVVLKVRAPDVDRASDEHEADLLRDGAVLVGFLGRDRGGALAQRLAARGVTAFSMDLLPRISRAQSMDALSSMSTLAGYKAALLAAATLGKLFPLLMTAAGTIAPARVFVLGAGVAGLQAIATARRLGAVVEAFDVRPAAREEVKSLGATFVGDELVDASAAGASGYAREVTEDTKERQRALLAARLTQVDAAITTAAVPTGRAPVLLTEAMVRGMRPGAVIVDLAASSGGNCELTEPGATVKRHGVTLIGTLDLAATIPVHASQMYARNLVAFLGLLVHEGALAVDFDDEILRDACLTRASQPAEALPPGRVT